jgi:RND family efflux transporter MFP subunit
MIIGCVMKNRLIVMLLLMTALPALVACGEKEAITKDEVRPVKAMQVLSPQPFGGRWFPGKATATQEVNLSFRVSGRVDRIPVDVGAEVKEGDLLARLDPQDYQVELNNAEAQISKASAELDLAESEYARVARVYDKDPGAVSKSMVDVRRAQLDTATAQVASAKAALERAKDNLNYTFLKAPFNGIIVERFVEQFEDVQANQQIIRLLDTSSIEFTVQIPETLMEHVDKIRTTGAYVDYDTYPGTEVPAKVKEVGKEASRTTRTYPVTLIMDQPDAFKILPGMAGKAKGDKAASSKIAEEVGMVGSEIPISSTFADDGGKTFVWLIDEQTKKVNRQEVKVVNLTEKGALVTGLEKGTWIVTAGVNTLVEGQQVRILE